MKKITFLFIILCTGQIYGMEQEQSLGNLPKEIHHEIVKALATSNNFGDTVQAVSIASALQGVRYDNLKNFTALVHILADKFNKSTCVVSLHFKTPIATEYEKLGNALLSCWPSTKLIQQGADVNFIGYDPVKGKISTPLIMAARAGNVYLVELLLHAGANPYFESPEYGTAIFAARSHCGIEKLLKEAMDK